MKRSQKNYDVARALSAAFDPLIDVCLELGITSPELESLLRSAFVQRAFEKLPPHSRTGRPPSTNKVSVAAGLHRNEVSKIRAGGAAIARETMHKERACAPRVEHRYSLYHERWSSVGFTPGEKQAATQF